MKKFFAALLILASFQGVSQDCVDSSLIDPAILCPMLYDPVCGCNGVTYSNSCAATYYGGVTSYTAGECGQVMECQDVSNVDFGICAMWLGYAWTGNGCIGISGCGYVVDNVDYTNSFYQDEESCEANCGSGGGCEDLSGVDFGMCDMWLGYTWTGNGCEGISGCGYIVDDVDYTQNFYQDEESCEAACGSTKGCEDLSNVDFGMCDMWLGYAWTGAGCTGISGCGYIVDNVDYTSNFYQELSECEAACGDPSDSCISQWQIEQGFVVDCSMLQAPVCGCDGIEYPNACHAYFYGGVTTYSIGACTVEPCYVVPVFVDFGDCEMPLGYVRQDNNMCVSISGCGYIGNNGYDYTDYFYESESACNEACGNVIVECPDPSLINQNVVCTQEYDPVCGCDSVTYTNDCVALNYYGVATYTPGECPTSSLHEIPADSFRVYPNPAGDLVQIAFPVLTTGIATIYDVSGKKVFEKNIYGTRLTAFEIDMLPDGHYLIQVIDPLNRVSYQRFVKE